MISSLSVDGRGKAVDKITNYESTFVLEDENGLSGYEYYYTFNLTLAYSHLYGTVRLCSAELLEAVDEFGVVNLNPETKKKIEMWLVEVYQYSKEGEKDLEHILG